MNNLDICTPGQIWESINTLDPGNYYQWRLVSKNQDGSWNTDVRSVIKGKPLAWRFGDGIRINPVKDQLRLALDQPPNWPPEDGAIWLTKDGEEIYFTGRPWDLENPSDDGFEFYYKNNKRDGYNARAIQAGALTFVKYTPINWSDYLPPTNLKYTKDNVYKPGQVWATRFNNIALVYRVHRVMQEKNVYPWLDIVVLAKLNSTLNLYKNSTPIRIANPLYTTVAVLIAESGCEPSDPDLIYQFLYK